MDPEIPMSPRRTDCAPAGSMLPRSPWPEIWDLSCGHTVRSSDCAFSKHGASAAHGHTPHWAQSGSMAFSEVRSFSYVSRALHMRRALTSLRGSTRLITTRSCSGAMLGGFLNW
jgi:hypothetical protein